MKKRIVMFFTALVFFILGLIPLLRLEAPSFLHSKLFLEIIIFIAGIFLVYITIKERKKNLLNIIAGLFLIFLGLFPLIVGYRLIDFSFIPILNISSVILALILLFYGLYLAIDSFMLD